MKIKIKIYEQGLEEYPKAGIIFDNLIMLLLIASGTVACWFFYPLIAWIYLVFAVMMVFVIPRKLVCINCYYYDKWCSISWGKLSALFFKGGNIEKFTTSIDIKIAPLTYGLLSLVPVILILIPLIQEFSVLKIVVFGLLLLIFAYSGAIGRKKAVRKL